MRGWGTLVMGEVGTPAGEMIDRAVEVHFRFWYWLHITESHGEVEDVWI